MVRHLHDLHLFNADAADVASVLQQASHVVANELGVVHEVGLILLGRAVGESRAYGSEDFQALVVQIELVVFDSIERFKGIDYAIVDYCRYSHW